MSLRTAVPALLALMSLIPAADLPLGRVERLIRAEGSVRADLWFDTKATADLQPGTMIAIYGPGTVEKHPLTKQVLISRPAVVAKGQLTGLHEGHWQARILWTATGAQVAGGMDAVPLPGEAAPNAPPTIGAVEAVAVPQGSLRDIALSASDPDGDPLFVRWILEGTAGTCGTLLESDTWKPQTRWIAPIVNRPVTAVATVTDSLGQAITIRVPLTTTAPELPRDRKAQPWFALGNLREPPLSHLARGGDGVWWAVAAPVGMTGSPSLLRLGTTLTGHGALVTKPEESLRKPVGLVVRGEEAHLLDASRGLVAVYGPDGAQRRTYGTFERAVDLAMAADGTTFVADGADRGVHVLEADGRYRCRLGRGTGEDGLLGLAAVALDANETVIALDPVRPALVRFDRFGRRLETWACPGDPKDPAVDVVAHPQRGALVLLTSGRVVPVTAAGLGEPLADPATTAGVSGTRSGVSLTIDRSGSLYAVLQDGLILRWNPDLTPAGVRGARLRTGDAWAADGQGRTYSLDRSSGTVAVFDAEQWQTARLMTGAKKALTLTVSPKGRYLGVVDARAYGVIRLDLLTPTRPGITLGQEGSYDGQFKEPVDAAFDDQDRLYVVDLELRRVAVLGADGAFIGNVGDKSQLADPERVAVHPDGSQVFVYDSDTYELKRFALEPSGRSASPAVIGGGKGNGPGQIRSVIGLACDRQGLLHVLDDSRGDLQILDFRGPACQPLRAIPAAELDLTNVDGLAIHPDGPMTVFGSGRLVGWHW